MVGGREEVAAYFCCTRMFCVALLWMPAARFCEDTELKLLKAPLVPCCITPTFCAAWLPMPAAVLPENT